VSVSAQAAANALIRLGREEQRPLTNMQVQKHVFLGQGYCLALVDRPLYYNNTHAWQWGPVVPKLYKALQQYGSGQVTADIPSEDELDPQSPEYNILRAVWNAYRKYSGPQLSEITHRPGSPWSKTWATSKFGVIPNDDIQSYFRELVASRK
jgi:uncharacterized phage-associated protein